MAVGSQDHALSTGGFVCEQQMHMHSASRTDSVLMGPRPVKVELVDDQEAEEQVENDPGIDMDKLRILLQRKPEMGRFLQVG